MTSAVLAGSTGLVGSQMLATLLSSPHVSSIHAYSRRAFAHGIESERLQPLTSTDTSTWPSLFPSASSPQLFLSALGTTRAAAGGTDNQRKIDLDLNYDLAKAAKEAGVTTYVLVSSGGANAQSSFAYPAMKGELEEKVKALGFKHTVILRPGLIVGDRQESRPAEAVARWIAGGLKKVAPRAFVDSWAQDADVIARAAVNAGLQCVQGKREEEGVWMLGQADIVKLGSEQQQQQQ